MMALGYLLRRQLIQLSACSSSQSQTDQMRLRENCHILCSVAFRKRRFPWILASELKAIDYLTRLSQIASREEKKLISGRSGTPILAIMPPWFSHFVGLS